MISVNILYTDNLGPEADMAALLATLAAKLREVAAPDEPILVGAQRLAEYAAPGDVDRAAVSAVVKVPAAQLAAFRGGPLGELFAIADRHFAELYPHRSIALSFELAGVGEENLVERLHRLAPTADRF
jgi:5-carboxymethyl-2-hydroxymuconate isomerase